MAFRFPLHFDINGDIRPMANDQIEALRKEAVRVYGLDPGIILKVVNGGTSGAGLGPNAYIRSRIQDTYYGASAESTTFNGGFPTPAGLMGYTSNWQSVYQDYSHAVGDDISNSANETNFLYLDGSNNIRPMSHNDMLDTIYGPALRTHVDYGHTFNQDWCGGAYYVTPNYDNTRTINDNTMMLHNVGGSGSSVDNDAVFIDRVADVTAFASGTLPEAISQTLMNQKYYLWKKNPYVNRSDSTWADMALPLYWRNGTEIQETPLSYWTSTISKCMKYHACLTPGCAIRYDFGKFNPGELNQPTSRSYEIDAGYSSDITHNESVYGRGSDYYHWTSDSGANILNHYTTNDTVRQQQDGTWPNATYRSQRVPSGALTNTLNDRFVFKIGFISNGNVNGWDP